MVDQLFWWIGAIVSSFTGTAIAFVVAYLVWYSFTAFLFVVILSWHGCVREFWAAWWYFVKNGDPYITLKSTGKRIYWPLWPGARSCGDNE